MTAIFAKNDRRYAGMPHSGECLFDIAKRKFLKIFRMQQTAPGIEDLNRLGTGFDLGVEICSNGCCYFFQESVSISRMFDDKIL